MTHQPNGCGSWDICVTKTNAQMQKVLVSQTLAKQLSQLQSPNTKGWKRREISVNDASWDVFFLKVHIVTDTTFNVFLACSVWFVWWSEWFGQTSGILHPAGGLPGSLRLPPKVNYNTFHTQSKLGWLGVLCVCSGCSHQELKCKCTLLCRFQFVIVCWNQFRCFLSNQRPRRASSKLLFTGRLSENKHFQP